MRVSKSEVVAATAIAVGTVLGYVYAVGLMQGVNTEWHWIRWVYAYSLEGGYTMIKDIVPVEVLVEALLAVTIIYLLCYRRRQLWQWLAGFPIPKWLSQSWLARIVEGYLTDDYALQRRALKYVPEDTKTVVDVGCGGATYLKTLDESIEKIGVDVSLSRLALAKRYCNRVEHVDLTESDALKNIRADTAFCFEVIEHITEEQGVTLLKQLERFPTVILTTPKEFFEVRRDSYEMHRSFWSSEKLLQYGYELVDSGRIPPSNIYMRRAQ